jgi:hypothetical protein
MRQYGQWKVHLPFKLRRLLLLRRLATGWTVRWSNSGRGEIFRICPDRTWGPPSLLHNGYQVFPGGINRRGRDADPSPLLVPRSKNRVELYLFVACKKGETYLYLESKLQPISDLRKGCVPREFRQVEIYLSRSITKFNSIQFNSTQFNSVFYLTSSKNMNTIKIACTF